MKKLNNYLYLLIFILIFIMAAFFPLTGKDLFWHNTNILDIFSLIREGGVGILTSLLLIILTKISIIKCLTISVITTSTFILMKNIVNKRNTCLIFIALFFILLLDKQFLSFSLVNTTGYTIHFVGSLFLLIFVNMFIQNSVANMNKILLFILGLIGTSLGPVYSFTIFLCTIVYMIFCKESTLKKRYAILLAGEVIGLTLTILNVRLNYTGFSNNLLHVFIPSIRGVNFFITLITSALLFFESIKLFNRYTFKTILCVISISLYLFVSLLSNNDIVFYIAYILYFLSSFYIMFHSRNTKIFKYKIFTFYLFKLLFIIFSCVFGEINPLFLYLMDIIIILVIYDYLLPINYLRFIWVITSLSTLCLNVYVYAHILSKFIDMNRYIKNELECSVENFDLPERFKTDYVYKNIPESGEDFEEYVKFYHINVYNADIKFYFNK